MTERDSAAVYKNEIESDLSTCGRWQQWHSSLCATSSEAVRSLMMVSASQ